MKQASDQLYFDISFPLSLKFNQHSQINFTYQAPKLRLTQGIYYISGECGSGKTSFLSMLALLSGSIGKQSKRQKGSISFINKQYSFCYSDPTLNYYKAAEIRETYFSIFSQEVFFLPGLSLCCNYNFLNNNNNNDSFSDSIDPSSLSGGYKQSKFMHIILSKNKPVWFLDEPFNNMDQKRISEFCNLLEQVYSETEMIIFIIDHRLSKTISDHRLYGDPMCIQTEKVFKINDSEKDSEIKLFPIKVFKAFINLLKS